MARFKNRDGQGGSDDYFHLIRVNPCFTCTFEDMKEAQSSSNESCHDICAPIRCAVAVSTLRSRDRLTTNNVWRVVNLSSNNTFFFSPSFFSLLSLSLSLLFPGNKCFDVNMRNNAIRSKQYNNTVFGKDKEAGTRERIKNNRGTLFAN